MSMTETDNKAGLMPGVYRNVPAAEYHAWKAVSSSVLKRLHTHSPAHAFDLMKNGMATSDEMDIGSAAHCLLFTPSEFDSSFLLAPRCCATTAKGDRCKYDAVGVDGKGEWFCGVHSRGKSMIAADEIAQTILSQDDMARVKGICAAIRANKVASNTIDCATDFELSILAHDPVTGLLCKARMDIYCGDLALMPDLKTCRSSDPKRFKFQARDLAYHIQLSFYSFVARLAGLDVKLARIIAAENCRPYPVTCFEPSDSFIATGERDMRTALNKFAECRDADEWPGYADQTQELDMP
jgi:hypothetical protein